MADKGRTFRTQVSLADMQRLADKLSDTQGTLAVDMAFGRDDRGIRFLSGSISGQLHLICERCLGKMHWPLKLDYALGLVDSEGMIERLPEQYEPLLVEQEEIRPLEVIEDEVLLALPMFPVHENEQDCKPRQLKEETEEAVATDEARDNPFAVLAKLKRND